MELSSYDFSPGILGLIIWAIISYLFRKKKIDNNQKSEEQNSLKQEALNLEHFENILEPQDIRSSEIFPLPNDNFQEIDIPLEINEVKIHDKKLEVDKPLIKDFKKEKQSEITLLIMLKNKNSLKSAFIMKEILNQPLSLRNYGR